MSQAEVALQIPITHHFVMKLFRHALILSTSEISFYLLFSSRNAKKATGLFSDLMTRFNEQLFHRTD